jgi:hypothetical protein
MRTPETFYEDLIFAIVDGQPLHAAELLTEDELPTWKDFIEVLDRAARRSYTQRKNHEPLINRQINDAIFSDVYRVNIQLAAEDQVNISRLQELWDELRRISPGLHSFEPSKVCLDLIGNGPASTRHLEHHSQDFFIQCAGTTDWVIYSDDRDDAIHDRITLRPGDGLFIASNYYYSFSSKTASAGLRFTLRNEEN